MKITKIDVLKVNTSMKGYPWVPVLCRIYTDEGIYGDGEAALAYGAFHEAAFGAVQDMARKVIGMDPLAHEVIWDTMYRTTFWGQNGGPVVFAAISAIDIALWDIKGKYYKAPVYELLGGKRRDKLRTYASQLQVGWSPDENKVLKTPEEYAAESVKAVSEGYDCIKIDFFTFDRDGRNFVPEDWLTMRPPYYCQLLEERISAVREAVGPGVDIIMENHSNIDAQAAVQLGLIAKKYGIMYFEEPTTPTVGLTKFVSDRTGLPTASGERIYSRWQYSEYFAKDALQVIQPDIGNCGGITECKKICDMAYIHDVNVQVHVCASPICTAAALQIEAAIPNFVIHEHHTFALKDDNTELCIYDYQPVNGYYEVPDLPGIGNEISETAFAKSTIVTVK